MNRVFQSWWWWIDKQSNTSYEDTPWILADNFWNDDGIWKDEETWND